VTVDKLIKQNTALESSNLPKKITNTFKYRI